MKNIMVFSIIGLIIGAGSVSCVNGYNILSENHKSRGFSEHRKEISLSEVLIVKKHISDLINKTEKGDIGVAEFIIELLETLKKSDILPTNYSIETLFNNIQSPILKEKVIKNNFFGILTDISSIKKNGNLSKSSLYDSSPPYHIGFPTMKISVAVGGSFGNTLTLPFFPLRNITIYDNISIPNPMQEENGQVYFYGGYNINPVIYIPGTPSSYHGLISIATFPGFQEYKEVYWSGNALIGVGIGEAIPLGITCVFPGEIGSVTLFDISISFTLFDICIRFPPQNQ